MPGPRGAFDRLLSRRGLLCFLAALQLVFWASLALVPREVTRGHLIGSDGIFYYEVLPSLVLDGDLDFTNQRARLQAEGVSYPWKAAWLRTTETGRPGTPFTVGWALLVSPFFLLAHALVHLAPAGWALRADGYGPLYEGLTVGGAALLGCAGLYLIYLSLRRCFSEAVAVLTTLLAGAATNAAYYIVVQGSMSHAVGLFAVAGLLHAALRLGEIGSPPSPGADARDRDAPTGAYAPVLGAYALFGLFAGLAVLVRPQLALVVLALGGLLLATARRKLPLFTLSLPIALGLASLQALAWWRIYGHPLLIPQGEGFLRPLHPELLAVLFSLRHGLMLWHPWFALAAAGLLLGLRSSWRALCAGLLLALGLELYVNAAVSDWWAQNSFGNRRFVDLIPLFAFGAAQLTQRLRSLRPALVAGALLVAWNLLFTVQYRFGYIPRAEPITWTQLTVEKLRLPWAPRRY